MSDKEIQRLVEKYFHNTASQEELNRLFEWYESNKDKESDWMMEEGETEEQLKDNLYNNIVQAGTSSRSPKVWRDWLSVAASLLVICSIGWYWATTDSNKISLVSEEQPGLVEDSPKPNDINPGGLKAILTLGNGTKVILDDYTNETIASQEGFRIHKNSKGAIEYSVSQNRNPNDLPLNTEEVEYNTIETPVGGRYQLNLADGSKVWLNSGSSLRFPVFFAEDNREVELKGEAYFEVSKDNSRKFSVRSGNQLVEVLGTHFNINAYANEPAIRTTLLEGRVRVIELNSKKSELLNPGDQAKVSQSIEVKRADPQVSVAWKEGFFNFKNADINEVMRQLVRWYGIRYRIEGEVMDQHFSGAIPTNLTLLELLEVLENSNIHFKLIEKEVIVMP